MTKTGQIEKTNTKNMSLIAVYRQVSINNVFSLKRTIPFLLAIVLLFIGNSKTIASSLQKDSLEIAKQLISTNPDSSIVILNNLEEKAKISSDIKQEAKVLIAKSKVYRAMLEYNKAFTYSHKALEKAKKTDNILILINAHTQFGIMNYVVFQEKESDESLQKALIYAKKSFQDGWYPVGWLLKNYQQIISQRIRFQKYFEANIYLDSCFILDKKHDLGKLSRAYLTSKKAFLLLRTEQIDSALVYFNKTVDFFENIKPDEYPEDHKSTLPSHYSYLAEIYRIKGEYDLSKKYFDKSIEGLKKYPWHHNHKPYVLEQYAWLLYETGEYEKATKYLEESKELSEKYFKAKSLTNGGFQEVSNRYRNELNQRMHELLNKSMVIAKKEKALVRFRIFTFFVIGTLLIAALIYRSRRAKQRYETEKEQIAAQEQQAKELIKLKNRELTVSTLKQVEKDEVIIQLCNELKKYRTQSAKILLKSINNSSDKMWEEFNQRFMTVNQDFYKKLNEKFPKLSSNDMKLCALIKLNFSTKEMSRLLGISTESTQKARHRLRKKLNLEREVNIVNFMSSL